MNRKSAAFLILFSFSLISTWAKIPGANENSREKNRKEIDWVQTNFSPTQELIIWRNSYPDVKFDLSWDSEVADWKLTVTNYNKQQSYYWCEGKYLPYEELANKDKYWRVMTFYDREVLDPKDFTPEDVEKLRNWSNNRKNGKVSSKFIFTAIYDDSTRLTTEQHIKKVSFLGKTTNIHEYLKPMLQRIEKRITELSNSDPEVKKFLTDLYSAEAYNWREIRDVNTRSFHSYGIAIDILPKMWGKKIVYWGFEKNNGNKDWMLIPLEKRWMPPKAVIDIFFEEGFIWGGTWAVWDNMHFEYHPELTVVSKIYAQQELPSERALKK